MVDKTLVSKLIAEMRRVRDEVMPPRVLEEFRGSRSATTELSAIRSMLDAAAEALGEQDSAKCLDAFGELKSL